MFVCHGNICRSTMAEFIMKDLVKKHGVENDFIIQSSATSSEELGNSVHYGTKAILDKLNISCKGKYAVKLLASDYEKYDMFIGMDDYNVRNMIRIFGSDRQNKIKKLLEYAGSNRDVADPWWTGDFDATYRDVKQGTDALFEFLGYKLK